MTHTRISRRSLLRGAGAAALLSRLGRLNSLAQSTTPDYRALVCVFLFGGNDGHNTVIPLSQAAFNAYRAGRGSLALPDSNGPLLQVQSADGTPYGLNPGLAAIHPLWAQGRLAVLANTGMLVSPVTRQAFLTNTVAVPTNLFSHSDQLQQMQSGFPSATGGTGWGGRTVDSLHALNGTSTFPRRFPPMVRRCFVPGVVQSASLLPGLISASVDSACGRRLPPTPAWRGSSNCWSSTADWL
ncbi:MAG: DUF1501 domain-containing protein [Verrucomicrobiota bacterium]